MGEPFAPAGVHVSWMPLPFAAPSESVGALGFAPPPPEPIVIDSDCVWVRAGFPASVTRTVKFDVAAVVGVPVIAPVLPSSERFAGRLPALRLNVYGVLPPVATTDWEYGVPTVPPGRLVVVIASGLRTSIASVFVEFFDALSVTRTSKEYGPGASPEPTLPEMTPPGLRLSPPGGWFGPTTANV